LKKRIEHSRPLANPVAIGGIKVNVKSLKQAFPQNNDASTGKLRLIQMKGLGKNKSKSPTKKGPTRPTQKIKKSGEKKTKTKKKNEQGHLTRLNERRRASCASQSGGKRIKARR